MRKDAGSVPIILYLLAWSSLADPQVVESNALRNQEVFAACIQELQMPEYPALARSTFTQGDLILTISMAAGRVVEVEKSGPPRLFPGIDHALEMSRFKNCGSQRISLKFTFALEGQPSATPRTTITVLGPDRYRILTTPPKLFIDR